MCNLLRKKNSRFGFTLVEIVVVIVLLLILAALALPTFIRIRDSSRRSALVSDARQLGSAAQQYMLERTATSIPLLLSPASGEVGGILGRYVKNVGKGYTSSSEIQMESTFTLAHPHVRGGSDEQGARGFPVVFNADGSIYR